MEKTSFLSRDYVWQRNVGSNFKTQQNMKNILFIIIIIFGTTAYSQSANKMLAEIENKWKQDENGDVTFTRIVELPNLSKKEIYQRALNYYINHYGNAKAISQTTDSEKGIITRKGMYEAHEGYNYNVNHLNVWHILTLTTKDNIAEIRLTLTEYEKIVEPYLKPQDDDSEKIYKSKVKDNYPVNPNGEHKTIMAKTFYKSYKAAMVSLDAIENGLKE